FVDQRPGAAERSAVEGDRALVVESRAVEGERSPGVDGKRAVVLQAVARGEIGVENRRPLLNKPAGERPAVVGEGSLIGQRPCVSPGVLRERSIGGEGERGRTECAGGERDPSVQRVRGGK